MSVPGMHSLSSTPPFRERLRQTYSGSPGPSHSPVPYQSSPNPTVYGPSKISSKQTLPKPPKAPEKPLMPYMRYSRKIWDSVKARNPELRLWQIGKIIGQMWRELPESEKKEYNDAYEVDKIQYQENLKAFHNSAQYQNFLREKQRAEHVIEEEDRRSKSNNSDQRVSIQPADYETDTDGGMSAKHIAAARYHRNQALINEIFSDSIVPDGRAVVTEHRMTVLKKQVRSLMEHQQKLERELGEITEKFNEKKRKFLESSEEFRKKLKEECDIKPVMTSAKFDALVIKHKAELRVRYDKMLEQQRLEQEKQKAEEKHQTTQQEENVEQTDSKDSKELEGNENVGADNNEPEDKQVENITDDESDGGKDKSSSKNAEEDQSKDDGIANQMTDDSQDSQASTIEGSVAGDKMDEDDSTRTSELN